MKPTKKQLKEIQEIEKNVSEVYDTKKTIEVTLNDKGVIINKETGEPHFPELFKNLQDELNSKELVISLSFGYKAPKLSKQLKLQGLEFDKELINDAELIRSQILSLGSVKILKGKEMLKAFTRLNKHIGKAIAETYCEVDEVAVLVKK
jgi:hypothetical protein